jgi:NAD(P) transhydrogenase subunit beta
MSGGLVTAAYIVAAILFIFSLAGLSKHETSQQGNNFGIAGMAIALIATIFGPDTGNVAWILVAMIIGGAIGIRLAKTSEMTEMPELVAILHSLWAWQRCWWASTATCITNRAWSRFWSISI